MCVYVCWMCISCQCTSNHKTSIAAFIYVGFIGASVSEPPPLCTHRPAVSRYMLLYVLSYVRRPRV